MAGEFDYINQEIREREQCILMSNVDEIISKALGFRSTFEGTGPIRKTRFKNFVQVDTDSPYEFISRITGNPSAGALTKLPVDVCSLLMPRLRLFMLKRTSDNNKHKPTPIELSFDNAMNPDAVEALIFGNATQTDGVGIKKFSWSYNGTDYSQVKNNVTADLVITMQSLQAFRKLRYSKLSDGTYLPYRYADLISDSAEQSNPRDNTFFKLYAIVGHAEPSAQTESILSRASTEAGFRNDPENGYDFGSKTLRQTLRNASVGLFLMLVDHNITYNQDGSVEISLKYHAAIEGILSDPKSDLFMLHRPLAERIRFQENYISNEIDSIKNEINSISNQKTAKTNLKRKNLEEDRKSWEEERRRIQIEDRRKLHASIIETLLESGKILSVRVKKNFTLPDEQKKRDEFIQSQVSTPIKQLYKITAIKGLNDNLGAADSFSEDLKTYKSSPDIEKAKDAFTNSIFKRSITNLITNDLGEVDVPFFFLGDLLDLAFGILFDRDLNNTSAGEVRPVVGPIQYFEIPYSESKDKNKSNIIQKSINIADLPISLNSFLVFIVDKIVKRNLTKYPIKMFIRDILTDLIKPILTERCVGTNFYTQTKVNFNIMTAPDKNGVDPLTRTKTKRGKISSYGGMRISDSSVGKAITTIGPLEFLREDIQLFNYAFLFATLTETSNLYRESEQKDIDRGIYTYRIGEDRGLLKNAEFKKTDQPYARSARIQRTYEQDNRFPDLFNFLKEKYDAELTLFGDPFIMPGQYIYISPNSIGSSTRVIVQETNNVLGLGGYYFVTNVSGTITPSYFESKVTAVQQSDGVRTSDRKRNPSLGNNLNPRRASR